MSTEEIRKVYRIVPADFVNSNPGWSVQEVIHSERFVQQLKEGVMHEVPTKAVEYLVFTIDPALIEKELERAAEARQKPKLDHLERELAGKDYEMERLKKELEHAKALLQREKSEVIRIGDLLSGYQASELAAEERLACVTHVLGEVGLLNLISMADPEDLKIRFRASNQVHDALLEAAQVFGAKLKEKSR